MERDALELEAEMDELPPRINDAVRRTMYGEAASYARELVELYEEWVKADRYSEILAPER